MMLARKAGSILVEVLLTVVIVSVSLTVLIGGLLSGYRVTLLNGDYSRAILLLENQMARLRYQDFRHLPAGSSDLTLGNEKPCSLNIQSGEFPMGKNGSLKYLNSVLSWASGKRTIRVL